MRILELSLTNFRCFEQCSLALSPRFSLLIGDNGSGKTVMLDALAVAAGSFLLGIPKEISRPIKKDDIRAVNLVLGQTVTRETVGETEVSVRGELDGVNLQWKGPWLVRMHAPHASSRALSKKLSRVWLIGRRRERRRRSRSWPITARADSGKHSTNRRSRPTPSARVSRLQGLSESASDQKRLLRWFKTNEWRRFKSDRNGLVLEAVRASIVAMIPGAFMAFWDLDGMS